VHFCHSHHWQVKNIPRIYNSERGIEISVLLACVKTIGALMSTALLHPVPSPSQTFTLISILVRSAAPHAKQGLVGLWRCRVVVASSRKYLSTGTSSNLSEQGTQQLIKWEMSVSLRESTGLDTREEHSDKV